MPRNYSVKQTIEMLKNGEAVIVGTNENQKVFYTVKDKKVEDTPTNPNPTAQKTVEKKLEKPEDEIIRFDHPDKETDNKKWYQFWK